jgi:hypothetical protein
MEASMTWTLNEIAMVGAQAANFPNHKVEHWTALRTCVEGIREFLRDINGEMTAIEKDRDLNPTGLARKRAEVGKKAVAKLDDFTKLQIAEHHVENRIAAMRQKIQAQIAQGEPKTSAEAALAGEIRAYIGKQQNPAMAAVQQKNDPRVIAAILNAPAFLSGLTDEQLGTFRAAALDSSDPAQEERQVSNALDVCRAAIRAAQHMIARRADLRRDPDGAWRYIKEALPRAELAA